MIKYIFGIVVMVVLGSAFFASLNSIKVGSFDPAVENASNEISEFGRDKFVRVGWNASEEDVVSNSTAREQFEGLMVWNMLSASDCMLLQVIDSGNTKKTMEDLREDGEAAYIGFEGFNPLLDTGFDGRCLGEESLIYKLKREAFSIAKIPQFTARRAGSPGHDMEGNYGKVRFNVSKGFHIDTKGDHGVLLGFHGKYDSPNIVDRIRSTYADVQGRDNIPDFWVGHRASFVVPPDINPLREYSGVFTLKDDSEIKGGGLGLKNAFNDFGYTDSPKKHKLYAWRVRAQGVPWIFESGEGLHSIAEKDCAGCYKGGEKVLDTALTKGEWHFCKGAKGHIISNAGSLSNRGEASSRNPKKEDSVFPKIVLSDPGEGKKCEAGGPKNFNKLVTTDNSYQDMISCSREDAANKKIAEDSEIVLGYENGEKKSIRYGCGLQKQEFDFGSYMGDMPHNTYDAEVTYHTPAVYNNCPSYREWYNLLPLRNGVSPGVERTLSDNSIKFGLLGHDEVRKLRITYEKREEADLNVDIGDTSITVSSSNSSVGTEQFSVPIDGDYDAGSYQLTYHNENAGGVNIPGGAGSSSDYINIHSESGEGQRKAFLPLDGPSIESIKLSADSGEVSLTEVSVYSYPTACN